MPMLVQLPPESEAEIKKQVKGWLLESVKEVKRVTNSDSEWLKGRQAVCKWLNISNQALSKLEIAGLQYHEVDGLNIQFYSKKEVTKFLLEH